jgi:carboxynorspermidine decarboxylase
MMQAGRFGMSNKKHTPYFVMYKEKILQNIERLKLLEKRANVHILHTIKSFNQASILPIISKKISGMSISSIEELKMAKKSGANYLHLYAPAFKPFELSEMSSQVESISFNSLGQWNTFKTVNCSKGLRINPKLNLPIPNHCNPNLDYSRLGVDAAEFLNAYAEKEEIFKNLEGLHFHALFQSSEQGLNILLEHILLHYKKVLPRLKWLNLGGGHNFTDVHYDVDKFCQDIMDFQKTYPDIKLFFEPGESVTKDCGEFISSVLDIVNIAGQKVVILDTSVETHLLDIAIVNMRLNVKGTQSESTPYFYELAGNSCMQGDYIGEYFFKQELQIGDKVIFEDMMSYTMVKMTEFNGMKKAKFFLDSISIED